MIKITTELLKSFNTCKKAIKWHKKQKTTSFNKLFDLCQRDNHLDWVNWLIVKLSDPCQLIRFTNYAAKKILYQYKKENRCNSIVVPKIQDYLEGVESIDWVQSAIYAAMGELSRKPPLIKILKHGIKLLKETEK